MLFGWNETHGEDAEETGGKSSALALLSIVIAEANESLNIPECSGGSFANAPLNMTDVICVLGRYSLVLSSTASDATFLVV